MRVEIPVGTRLGAAYSDRFFGDPIPELDLDFEDEYAAGLFRTHRTFPAFLPGVGDCPSFATCDFVVPPLYDWVAVSPTAAVDRADFQEILDQVREEAHLGRIVGDMPFLPSLYDVSYELRLAIGFGADTCVIGWSPIVVPERVVTLRDIPLDPSVSVGVCL